MLFPAIHEIMSDREYDDMGEAFEKEEHPRFGKDGFEEFVKRVGQLERDVGIYDLATATPV